MKKLLLLTLMLALCVSLSGCKGKEEPEPEATPEPEVTAEPAEGWYPIDDLMLPKGQEPMIGTLEDFGITVDLSK